MKGHGEDISGAEKAIEILGGELEKIHEYRLDGDTRKIVAVKKISQIPSKYPRKSGQIKKKPL